MEEDLLKQLGLDEYSPNDQNSGKISTKPEVIQCPFCLEEILESALKCKHCGEFVAEHSRRQIQQQRSNEIRALAGPRWNRGLAAVFSLLIPGAGQIYKGEILKGIILVILTPVGYLLLIIPGLFIHLYAILDAYISGDPAE